MSGGILSGDMSEVLGLSFPASEVIAQGLFLDLDALSIFHEFVDVLFAGLRSSGDYASLEQRGVK